MTVSIKAPRTLVAATTLAERFAVLEGEISLIEAGRHDAIARANAEADKAGAPLLQERDAIRDKLKAWWAKEGAGLTDGKRKSIELGGCLIGGKAGRTSLALATSEDAAVQALQQHRWAKALLRTKVSIDKAAVLKSIDGVYGKQLAEIGFSRATGEETFILERAEQAGTVASAK